MGPQTEFCSKQCANLHSPVLATSWKALLDRTANCWNNLLHSDAVVSLMLVVRKTGSI